VPRWTKLGSIALLALGVSMVAGAQEQEPSSPIEAEPEAEPFLRSAPARDEGPIEVQIGFHLIRITDVDEREETIDFEGGLQMLWHDDRLAYDPADYGRPDYPIGGIDATNELPPRIFQGDFAVKEVFAGWRPQVRINNGIGDRHISWMAVAIWPDGSVGYTDKFHAKAETPMNLKQFPFDDQRLEVFVAPYAYQRHQLLFLHRPELVGAWDQNAGIADWESTGLEIEERPTVIEMLSGGERTYTQLVIAIELRRRPGHILFSIILPLLILVSLTWSVFWMDEESISDRVNVSFVGILSVVAYYFVVLDSVPQIPYPTMMDAFMITTFFILAGTVIVSFVVDKLNKSGRKETGDRVDRVCRWAFPLGYVVVTSLVVIGFTNL